MDTGRVVEIDWEGGYGSGYLIAPGVVLTARHVLEADQESEPNRHRNYQVRALGENPSTQRPDWDEAELAWFGNGKFDIAVLRVLHGEMHGLTVFGRPPDSAAQIKCRTIGFPLATAQSPAGNDTYQLDGTIATGTYAVSGELAVTVDSPPPEDPDAWPGMSGAALFAGDHLIGVIKSYSREFGAQMLKATPLSALANDPKFCAALGQPFPLPLEVAAVATDSAARAQPRPPRPVYYDLPSRPDNYQDRPEAVLAVKCQLLGDVPAVGVYGMAGIGKTVLATALVQDDEVRAHFASGIIWLTFGHEADSAVKQAEMARALSGEPHSIRDWSDGRGQLSKITQSERLLVVLDDLWDIDQVDVFGRLGPNCRLLVTTRDRQILDRLLGNDYELDLLSPKAAQRFLAEATGSSPDELPSEASAVAEKCGYLPLALASAGALVARGRYTWPGILERLRKADLKRLKAILPEYQHEGVLASLDVSVSVLDSEERDGFFDCAVFPEDADVPEPALLRLWSQRFEDPEDARDLADRLVGLTLLRRVRERGDDAQDQASQHYRLHDLYRDYLFHEAAPLAPRHDKLLRAYKPDCPSDWADMPVDDGYYFQNLVRHLLKAERGDEAEKLLMTYRWIAAKLDATGIAETIADYDQLHPDPRTPLGLVREVLRMSLHVLLTHPEELPGHLVGRLLKQPSELLISLVHEAKTEAREAWLCPMTPSPLNEPEENLGQFLPHGDSKIAVFCIGDDRAVSVDAAGAPKVWDTRSMVQMFRETSWSQKYLGWQFSVWEAVIDGRPRVFPPAGSSIECAVGCEGSRLLVGHRKKGVFVLDAGTTKVKQIGEHNEIRDIDISQDGRRAFSGGDDHILKYWNLESRREISSHDAGDIVDSVAISPDGRSAVYSCKWAAHLIFVPDLARPEETRLLDKLSIPVLSLRFEPDGQYIVAGCYDGWLRRYALKNGQVCSKIGRHADAIVSMAFAGDHSLVTTARRDDRVGVWDTRQTQASGTAKREGQLIETFAYLSTELAVSGSADSICRTWDLRKGVVVNEQPLVIGGLRIGRLDQIVAVPGAVVIDSGSGISKWKVDGERLKLTWAETDAEFTPGTRRRVGFDAGGHCAVRAGEVSRKECHLELVEIDSGKRRVLFDYVGPDEGTIENYLSDDGMYVTGISPIRAQRSLVAIRTVKLRTNYLEAWNTGSQARLWKEEWPNAGDTVRGITISPNGRMAAVGSFEGCLSLWSIDGRELLLNDNRTHSSEVTMLAFVKDGMQLISACPLESNLNVWDVESLTLLRQLDLGSKIESFVANQDGQYLWISLENRRVVVWDIDQWTEVARLEADSVVKLCAAAPDSLGVLGRETEEGRNAVILKLEIPPP